MAATAQAQRKLNLQSLQSIPLPNHSRACQRLWLAPPPQTVNFGSNTPSAAFPDVNGLDKHLAWLCILIIDLDFLLYLTSYYSSIFSLAVSLAGQLTEEQTNASLDCIDQNSLMGELDACQASVSDTSDALEYCYPPCSDFYIKFAEKCEAVFTLGDQVILRAWCETDFLPGSPPSNPYVASSAIYAHPISISNIMVGLAMVVIAVFAF